VLHVRALAWLRQSIFERQSGQFGPATGAGLVPDPVKVRADGADTDEELLGDLAVGETSGNERDQLALTSSYFDLKKGPLAGS